MKLIIDEQVYKKVMHWVNKAGNKEISGLGNIKIENGNFKVISAILLPQKNGAATTDIEPEAVCKAMYDLRNSEGELKWWWHSHVDMGVFWSGTDHSTIQSFGSGGWAVATVFNKKAEKKTAFYSKDGKVTPIGIEPLFIDDIITEISGDPKDTSEWDAEFKANVTDLETPYVPPYQGNYGRWQGYGNYWDNNWDENWQYPSIDMTKKERRELKKQQKASGKDLRSDAYGFSPVDWEILSGSGFDTHEVDFLISSGLKSNEILRLAKEDFTPQEVTWFLENKYSFGDMLDYQAGGLL